MPVKRKTTTFKLALENEFGTTELSGPSSSHLTILEVMLFFEFVSVIFVVLEV